MRSVSTEDLVRAWEMGEGRPKWFRGLIMLALTSPERPLIELAQLTIGQRNRGVARLRAALFGSRLTAICPCPRCGTVAEFSAAVHELAPWLDAKNDLNGPFEIVFDERRYTCRPPTSEDLAALDFQESTDFRHPEVLRRCLTTEEGEPFNAMPSEALANAVLEGWYEHDPGVESDVQIDCDRCRAPWVFGFDWLAFTWIELTSVARRRLEEVHVLANAYGWRETDILALGPSRRTFYLNRVMS